MRQFGKIQNFIYFRLINLFYLFPHFYDFFIQIDLSPHIGHHELEFMITSVEKALVKLNFPINEITLLMKMLQHIHVTQ